MNILNPWYQPVKPALLEYRVTWFLLALFSAGMLWLGHAFFQTWLFLAPCVFCVYIRAAFLGILIASLIGTLAPRHWWSRVPAVIGSVVSAVYGWIQSWNLVGVHVTRDYPEMESVFGIASCSMRAHFPFGVPLHEWLPSWFAPKGICGFEVPRVPNGMDLSPLRQKMVDVVTQDHGWFLIPYYKWGTMGDLCLIVFTLLLLGFFFAILFGLRTHWRRYKEEIG